MLRGCYDSGPTKNENEILNCEPNAKPTSLMSRGKIYIFSFSVSVGDEREQRTPQRRLSTHLTWRYRIETLGRLCVVMYSKIVDVVEAGLLLLFFCGNILDSLQNKNEVYFHFRVSNSAHIFHWRNY